MGEKMLVPQLHHRRCIYYFIDLRRDLLSSLGCMAERLKKKILETDKMVDLVAGPGILCHTNGVYLS